MHGLSFSGYCLPIPTSCLKSPTRKQIPLFTGAFSIHFYRSWYLKKVVIKLFLHTEPCTSDGICKPEPSKGPFICEEGSSSKIPVEKIEPADSKEDEGVSKWGFTYSLSEWLNKWRKKEDNSSMPQAAPLDKKVKTESSTTKSFLLESLFGKGDASCEATVHRASKTRTAKPKGIALFIAVFFSLSVLPNPKCRIFVWTNSG